VFSVAAGTLRTLPAVEPGIMRLQPIKFHLKFRDHLENKVVPAVGARTNHPFVQTTRRLFVGVQAAADGFFAGLQCLSPFLITKPLWLDADFA